MTNKQLEQLKELINSTGYAIANFRQGDRKHVVLNSPFAMGAWSLFAHENSIEFCDVTEYYGSFGHTVSLYLVD